MKSAYELAMERLNEVEPDGIKQLTDEQREALAEIDRKYQAKVAEKEVFLQQQIVRARAAHDADEVAQIEKQLRNERERLEAEKERAKQAVREGTP